VLIFNQQLRVNMKRNKACFFAVAFASMTAHTQCALASDVENAQEWLNKYVSSNDAFSLTLIKNKISFKGCKQKRYQLSLTQQLTPAFNIEARVNYNRGLLNYGVLSQRVRTHEFEVVSWWKGDGYRVGLSHKIKPEHEMSVPVADVIQLPTSTTAGLYVEVPFNASSHTLTIAALRESWDANNTALTLPWRDNHDSQIKVQYAMAF